MGIDIRDGEQLECINCALCIDACDAVMKRIDLPTGLIRYDTPANASARAQGLTPQLRLIRPRTVIYTTIIIVVGVIMLASLSTRSDVEMNVLRDRNPLFVKMSDGGVRNRYTVKILNKRHDVRRYALRIDGLSESSVKVAGGGADTPSSLMVRGDRLRSFRIMVTAPPKTVLAPATAVVFRLRDLENDATVETDSTFRAPAIRRRAP
jgi:cytochrome c oxidase accessory protein FixG